jgi:hypothetical protein
MSCQNEQDQDEFLVMASEPRLPVVRAEKSFFSSSLLFLYLKARTDTERACQRRIPPTMEKIREDSGPADAVPLIGDKMKEP